MPAPAVIPAPRAYINAVAVKGFVVELRPAKAVGQVPAPSVGPATAALAGREHHSKETSPRERQALLSLLGGPAPGLLRVRRTHGGTPATLTVTKKA